MNELYNRLRERIDQRSVGFCTTPSGIEMKILERIFTPEEANIYLNLSKKLEPVKEIALRADADEQGTGLILERMTKKGLTFPKTKNGVKYYAAAPFMHGFFEHQAVTNMDKDLAQMYENYFSGGFIPKTHALRTVPINKDLKAQGPILPYDDVKKIIESKERIGLMPCACASKMKLLESGCKQPINVCIGFDFYAEYAIEELGVGKWITQAEALKLLDETEKAGLVHQTGGDSRNTECICNCCSDCCVSLRMFKFFPQPAKIAGSNYQAKLYEDQCTQCESCISRCPMNAITAGGSGVSINPDRCIGCGLCTSICPSGAIILNTKPEDKIKPPPSPEKYKFMRSSIDFYKDVE